MESNIYKCPTSTWLKRACNDRLREAHEPQHDATAWRCAHDATEGAHRSHRGRKLMHDMQICAKREEVDTPDWRDLARDTKLWNLGLRSFCGGGRTLANRGRVMARWLPDCLRFSARGSDVSERDGRITRCIAQRARSAGGGVADSRSMCSDVLALRWCDASWTSRRAHG